MPGIDFQQFLKGNEAAGMEVELLPNGSHQFHFCLLKRNKEVLDIESSRAFVKDISELKVKTGSNVPVCIAINGKGIIHKKIEVVENDTEDTLIGKVLPNARVSDFYIQKVNSTENQAFVSIIRKNVIDELLQKFKDEEYFVTDMFIGPFHLSGIANLLDNTANINIAGHALSLEHGMVTDYIAEENTNSEKNIRLGKEIIESKAVIAFAAAFQYFVANVSKEFSIPAVEIEKEEFKHQRIFQIGGWTVLSLFFAALLINFVLFDHYNSKAQELQIQSFQNKDQLLAIEKLRAELKQKQEFLNQMGLLEPSRTSYYADQISLDLPETIQLIQLFIHPMEKKIAQGKKEIVFATKTLSVSGVAKKSTQLNDWLKVLKSKDWIKGVSIINYSQDDRYEPGKFDLEITMK
ncbi:MAG: hypothetical protein COA57_04905 [Flavobacteriales bacterium]|nr:MAG: hypothetical protein COA57_04905 [Flavobacteriales bacterium]